MTEYRANRPDRPPTHPGVVLREDVLPALGMKVAPAARDLRISRQLLHRILKGEASISLDLALRLGKFCGNGPEIWLAMQVRHDLWHAKRDKRALLENIPTRAPAPVV